MKLIIILSICAMACAAEYYTLPAEDYTPEKLKNDRVEIKRRLDCYLDRKPCTPLTEAHKSIGVDVVRTACAKCSPELKSVSRTVLELTQEWFPEDYLQIRKKYDPSGKHYAKFEQALGVNKLRA